MMSQFDCLRGKYVLVTGASRGLGRSIAIEYASMGCNVVLVGRSHQDLLQVYSELEQLYPGDHFVQPRDLSDVDDIMKLVNTDILPSIDILVNCAGVFPISRIINIASSSAYAGSATTSAYCASKHALLGLSRSLHKEFKDHNVRVICVSPGSIKTDMGRKVENLGQDFDTFMEPEEVAKYIVYNSSFDGNLVSEEIRLNRMFVQ